MLRIGEMVKSSVWKQHGDYPEEKGLPRREAEGEAMAKVFWLILNLILIDAELVEIWMVE